MHQVEADVTFTVQFDVRLRPARRDDLPLLEWFGQYRHFRLLYQRTFELQEQGTRLMLLADVGGFPVGQIFISFEGVRGEFQSGYLYSLRVLEPFRGRGIGTRLIRAAEDILRARGYQRAVIAVSRQNDRARRLYERLGYVVYREDAGRWQYTDHHGRVRRVHDPSWMLHKSL